MFYLLVPSCDEPDQDVVIHKLKGAVSRVGRYRVMSVEGIEEKAQQAAMGRTGAQSEDGGQYTYAAIHRLHKIIQ